jgi:hypothetical protein
LISGYEKEAEMKSSHFERAVEIYAKKGTPGQKMVVIRCFARSTEEVQHLGQLFKTRVTHRNLCSLLGVKLVQQKEMCSESSYFLVAYEHFGDNLADELLQR